MKRSRHDSVPGETLQIINQQVHINGKPVENPEDAQFTYAVFDGEHLFMENYVEGESSL